MMKKMMHILVLSIIILSITSCKKEYVYTCAMLNVDGDTYQRDFVAKAYKKEKAREFYIKATKKENYSTRELNRQVSASLFERTMIRKSNLSSVVK